MLAALTKVEEFGINKPQSEILGEAIANVARHYDVAAVSQKSLDWFNLFQVAALVYGPVVGRVIAARKAKRARPDTMENPMEPDAFDIGANPNMYDMSLRQGV